MDVSQKYRQMLLGGYTVGSDAPINNVNFNNTREAASKAIRDVLKQTLKPFAGECDNAETRAVIDIAIKNAIRQYLPIGVNIDDVLRELETDDMFEKLEELGL